MTFANEAYCRFFGLSRDDVLGRRFRRIVHPDDAARVEAEVATLGPGNRLVVIENRVLRADGAVRWTEWTNQALYDGDGRLLELQSIGRDVTERRRAEDDAARLAALVASADDAIIGKTLDGVITSWNRAAEEMFGYSAAEAVGERTALIVPPERLEEHRAILDGLRRGESVEHFETERVHRDGRRIPVALTVSPIRDARGRVVGGSKIARDITERRRADTRLRATLQTIETLYRLVDRVAHARTVADVCGAAVDAIVATGADRAGVLVLDDAGVMRFRAWRGLSDRYRAAVDGHSPWPPGIRAPEPIAVEDAAADPRLGALREVIAAEGIRALAFVPLVDQGRLLGKFMMYHDAPHRFSDEELRRAAIIARHVAFGLARVQGDAAIADLLVRERRARAEADAARADAERMNRAKDEFLAMLAHELRNPLSVIVNAISIINDSDGLAADARRAGAMVSRQAAHLARLLDDLLDVARIVSGRIEMGRELVDLGAAVGLAVEAQRHWIDARGQRLSVAVPDHPLRVAGDPVRLQQVIGNLLNNASKYTPPDGSIWVALEADGDEAVLRVRDDGAGIPADMLESIFDLFAQANPTPARTAGGLGIGLTLVKRVVEFHGGAIRAASEGPGRGAEFVVRLPLAAAFEPHEERRERVPSVAPRRILVIEDHDDGREIVALALRLAGHDVLEAATGHEGLALAARSAPDVVVVDIGLPDMQGYEVARRLRRALGSRVRIIALTGYGQPRDRARSEEAGFDAHLVKPVDPAALAAVLDRLT